MSPTTVSSPSRFAQLAEGIPRSFWALLVGTFITKAGAFVMPLLFVYLTQVRMLPLTLAGPVTALYGLGSFAGSLVGGVMADRFGRRFTMLISLLVGAGFLLILGLSTELWQLAIATLLTGFTADAYRPASQALVADVVPPEHRMKAFGMQYWAINLGFAFASVIGGYMATRNFGVLFVGDALTTVVLAFIVWREVPESKPAESRTTRATGDLLTPFKDKVFARFLLLNFAVALIFFQHLSALPDDLKSKGLDTGAYGLSIATNGLLIVLTQPFFTRWAARIPARRILALAAFLTAVGFGMTTFASSLPMYVLSVAVWTLGEILFSPVNATIVAERSPVHLRGRYQGAFTITWSVASMLAPLISTQLIPVIGHRGLWVGCFLLGTLVTVAHLMPGRADEVPKAAMPE